MVVKINSEVRFLVDLALNSQISQLQEVLDSQNLQEDVRQSILFDVRNRQGFVSETFDRFRTSKLIEGYLRDNFDYLPPRTLSLGSGSFQYIPIIDTLKKIQADRTFQKMKNLHAQRSPVIDSDGFLLEDIQDGLVFKENKFFLENPDALKLILYSDIVQVTNPLAGNKHKIFCLYMTLGDIPRSQRSKLDSIFTVIVADHSFIANTQCKDDKKDILQKLYEPLLNDLAFLEKEGIDGVKAGVVAYCGDNLELHDLGMFNRAFNGGHICRFCTISHKELSGCDGFVRHSLWDVEQYDRISSAVENGEDIENFSLRGKCLLNELDSFHAANSLAPDLLHDFLEGLVSYDLVAILKCLKKDNWFTAEEYNKRISKYKFSFYEAGDQPNFLKPDFKQERLQGKAMSNMVHLRNIFFTVQYRIIVGQIPPPSPPPPQLFHSSTRTSQTKSTKHMN